MSAEKFKEIDVNIEKLENGDLSSQELYNHKMVNWSGPRAPDRERGFYTDYIAKQLLERQDLLKFDDIKSDRDDYFVKSHDGSIDTFTNRKEEIFAKSLFSHNLEHLGKVIDYQMPLKKVQTDSLGKVDLVSLNADNNSAYLIELKLNITEREEETVLRAALEIETYYHALKKNRKRFEEYIDTKVGRLYGEDKPKGVDSKTIEIRKALLFAVDNNSGLPQELMEENAGQYRDLRKLMTHLGINVYVMPYRYPVQKISLA